MDSKFIAIGAAAIVVIVALVAVVGLGMGSNSNDDGQKCITYDGNGGTHDGKTVVKGSESNTTVLGIIFSYDGHTFVSWNTAKDGSGKSYSPNDQANLGTVLYAQWTKADVSLTGTIMSLSDDAYVRLESLSDKTYVPKVLSGLIRETLPADPVITITGNEKLGAFTATYIDGYTYITYDGESCYVSIAFSGAEVTVRTMDNGVGYVLAPTGISVSIVDWSIASSENVLYYINDGSSNKPTSIGSNIVKSATDLGFISTHDFVKWNTKADGSGTDFKPGDTVPYGIRLYAIWEK